MRKRSLVFLAALLLLLTAACSNGKPNTGVNSEGKENQTEKGGEVTFALQADIVSLDPAFSYDSNTSPVVNQITEGLLKFDEKLQLAPNLAEKWENPDPKTYIYHIRKDVKFHDGTPMTVEDVIFSMERTRDPKTAAYTGWMYNNVDKIEKVDDSTVKVTLKQPDALWRYTPATSVRIISKAYYEAHKDNFGKPDGGVMGTGPFKYVRWQTGSSIELTKNEQYWDKSGGPYLDKVVFKVIPEGTTRVTGLKTGQIDGIINIPLDLFPIVEGLDNVTIQHTDSFITDLIAFNTKKKPFDDPNVRKAMNYTLNKKKIITEIVKNAGMEAKAVPISPAIWTFAREKWEAAYKELPDYAFNLEKAKEYLAKSSVPNGFQAKILTDNDTIRINSALALQAAVKPLGIDLEIEKVTGAELTTRSVSGARDYDILMSIWGSDFPDPVGNLTPVFYSKNSGDGGGNFANYKNPKVDALLDEQITLTDDQKRSELMIQAQKLIAEDTPWIVLDHPKQIFATNKHLQGYVITPMWYWDTFTKDMRLTR